MAHKTLIGGTAYEISGGRTLIGGTGYEVSGGKTLVGGTGYDICFGVKWSKYNTTSDTTSEYVESDPSTVYVSINPDVTSTFYSGFSFSSSRGYYSTGSSVSSTINENMAGYCSLLGFSKVYQYLSFSRILTTGWYSYRTTIYECEEVTTTTYSKGTTSYGNVIAKEGDVPDGGTVVQGTLESGVCAVDVDGTIYWYELA